MSSPWRRNHGILEAELGSGQPQRALRYRMGTSSTAKPRQEQSLAFVNEREIHSSLVPKGKVNLWRVGLTEFKIEVTEHFENLPRAPIVEAVFEIRTRAADSWDERTISEQLKPKLPDYPHVISQSDLQVTFSSTPPKAKPQVGWKGLRFQSADARQVVQFNRDGFLFSRLQPYESWERFRDEALRLWAFHKASAHPMEIQRVGLRFINRLRVPPRETRFEDYIHPYPQPPSDLDLPFQSFFHLDQLTVPGYPYAINIVRTIEPPQDLSSEGFAIIIDIDVYSDRQFELREDVLLSRLAEMRCLKNKAFFGSVTRKALETFR